MKSRYTLVPNDLTLSGRWERLSADARYLWTLMLVSPRTDPPGVYGGTNGSLSYETGLPSKRVAKAVAELVKAGTIHPLKDGIFLPDHFRNNCCNPNFAVGALRIVDDKHPDAKELFRQVHRETLARYGKGEDGEHKEGD